MPRNMSEDEVNALVDTARAYCETRANHAAARDEGRLSAEQDEALLHRLQALDERISMLKSSNEVVRRRARMHSNVMSMAKYLSRKAAR